MFFHKQLIRTDTRETTVLFGIGNFMMANEQGNLGVIVLITTRTDDQEKQVREAKLQRSMASDQRLNFICILEIITILCFYVNVPNFKFILINVTSCSLHYWRNPIHP